MTQQHIDGATQTAINHGAATHSAMQQRRNGAAKQSTTQRKQQSTTSSNAFSNATAARRSRKVGSARLQHTNPLALCRQSAQQARDGCGRANLLIPSHSVDRARKREMVAVVLIPAPFLSSPYKLDKNLFFVVKLLSGRPTRESFGPLATTPTLVTQGLHSILD